MGTRTSTRRPSQSSSGSHSDGRRRWGSFREAGERWREVPSHPYYPTIALVCEQQPQEGDSFVSENVGGYIIYSDHVGGYIIYSDHVGGYITPPTMWEDIIKSFVLYLSHLTYLEPQIHRVIYRE